METHLGQYLVEQGAITEQQLLVALEMQNAYGGRLGFNLVDLGVLSTEELSAKLASYHRLPAADLERLEEPAWNVFRDLPLGTASHFRVIPLEAGREGMTVAMSDPGDVRTIQDLEFATGHSVHVRVAPDFVIKRVFEDQLGAPTAPEFSRPPQSEHIMRLRAAATGGAFPAVASTEDAPDFGALAVDPSGDAPEEAWRRGFARACQRFGSAEGPEHVLDALLEFAEPLFARSAIFVVQDGVLVGRKARGHGLQSARFGAARIPLGAGLVRDAVEAGDAFVALIEDPFTHRAFATALGDPADGPVGLVPVRMDGEVIAVVYADGGKPGAFDEDVGRLGKVAEMAGRACELLASHEARPEAQWAVRLA